MDRYHFIKKGGRPVVVSEQQLAAALLRINGGGYNADQTANAKLDRELLHQGKSVKRGDWIVTRAA